MLLPKMSKTHLMQIMTSSEVHTKWKHFKALLLMELNVRTILCIGDGSMYFHANFQDATVYNRKVSREKALLFYSPSY